MKSGPDLQDLVKNRPGHCPEAVAGHGVFVVSHPAKSRENGKVSFFSLLS
jgi:hypothetical protein